MKSLKTFFYSLKKSLLEPKYYKEVAQVKFWFSFKYLLCLLLILSVVKVFTLSGQYVKSRPQIQPGVYKFLSYANNFYPKGLELKITKGVLSTNVKEPYIFDLEKDQMQKYGKHFLIIDTKESIENYPNFSTYILATKNAVVYPSKSSNSQITETQVFYFSNLKKDFTLNKNIYDSFLNVVKPYAPRILFFVDFIFIAFLFLFLIFGSLFWTGGVMFGLLFLTLVVWLVNLIFKKQYSYGSLFKMGMHAVTLPILISEISKYLNSPYPTYYSWILFIWMLVIVFTSKNKKIGK